MKRWFIALFISSSLGGCFGPRCLGGDATGRKCDVSTKATIAIPSTPPTVETYGESDGCLGPCGDGVHFSTPVFFNLMPSRRFFCDVTINGPVAAMSIALPSPAVATECGAGATLTSGTLTIESVGANDFRATFSMSITTADGTDVEVSKGEVTISGCRDVDLGCSHL